jgi:hypothetical protein
MKILSAAWWTNAPCPERQQQRHHGCRSTRAPAVAEGQEVQVRGNAAYRTRLDHADLLLDSYRRIPSCVPGATRAEPVQVRGNAACPLALHELMLDAPKG